MEALLRDVSLMPEFMSKQGVTMRENDGRQAEIQESLC